MACRLRTGTGTAIRGYGSGCRDRPCPTGRSGWHVAGRHRLRFLCPVAVVVTELLRGGRRGCQPPAMRRRPPLCVCGAWAVAAIRARLSGRLPVAGAQCFQGNAARALRHHAFSRTDPPTMEKARLLHQPGAGGLFQGAAGGTRQDRHPGGVPAPRHLQDRRSEGSRRRISRIRTRAFRPTASPLHATSATCAKYASA